MGRGMGEEKRRGKQRRGEDRRGEGRRERRVEERRGEGRERRGGKEERTSKILMKLQIFPSHFIFCVPKNPKSYKWKIYTPESRN